MAWFLIKAPEMLRWQAGKPVLPTIVSVVDLKSNTGKTAAGPALSFLKRYTSTSPDDFIIVTLSLN